MEERGGGGEEVGCYKIRDKIVPLQKGGWWWGGGGVAMLYRGGGAHKKVSGSFNARHFYSVHTEGGLHHWGWCKEFQTF